MKKQLSLGFSALVLAAALAGCGSSSGTSAGSSAAPPASSGSSSSSSSSSSAASSSGAELKVASSSAGQILVDSRGMSLYFFTKDVKDSGKSSCTGACLALWPVLTTTSATPAVDGVTGTVGTIATPDGKKQVTLNGMPLYYYSKDKKPGDVLGQGVGSVWYLAGPSGEMVKGSANSGY
ncbi:hypothetical protein [Arthrobacter sp. efr-133-TYG-104]|uniref:COG4315 family predicted lipoprotein n=1 Tax=Arthrobacter sp. efr-133-TYG-104 TaxID=3040324 RepID=UPI00254AE348|nr:hypothetical protein [Arthrobacter sp. efr-133-TYG-104]